MRAAIVALAVLLMGAGVAEAAGGRADLLERAPVLSGARVVEPGDTLVVTDAVKNCGRRRARAARTRFLLSRDALPGADDLVLGERRTPRLRRRRTSRRVVTLIVPAAVEPGAWTLIACADATRRVRERRERDNCRAALLGLRVPAPPPPPLPPAPAPPPAQVPRAIEPPPAPDPEPPPQPTGRAAIEDCDPSVADAEDPAGAFTAMFAATTLGWTGGDSTLSAMLPGGE
ncbi:MAG TPA: CARDB domain-containing protein, partial [Solirubrobacteraceae bacterium]